MTDPLDPDTLRTIVDGGLHRIDSITPDVPGTLTRAETGTLAVIVGLTMASEVLRMTAELSPELQRGVADALTQTADEMQRSAW